MTADDDMTTDIILEGDPEEIERFRRDLNLVEKGMVYVKVRPTRFNLEIRSTRPLDFGRFCTSRIGFWLILPTRCGLFWV